MFMKLSCIRHAQHIPSEKDVFHEGIGLTDSGIRESLEIRAKLLGNNEFTEIATFNHVRALGTLAVVIGGDKDIHSTDNIISDTRLSYDENLDYLDPGEGEFGSLLLESYLENRNFPFLVNMSDLYYTRQNPISSFTYMASNVAKGVLGRYTEEDLSENVLLCAREFILPVLRAKLVLLNNGSKDMSEYVDWYTDTQEATDHSRLTVTRIDKVSADTIRFVDAFTDSVHSIDELRDVADEIDIVNESS